MLFLCLLLPLSLISLHLYLLLLLLLFLFHTPLSQLLLKCINLVLLLCRTSPLLPLLQPPVSLSLASLLPRLPTGPVVSSSWSVLPPARIRGVLLGTPLLPVSLTYCQGRARSLACCCCRISMWLVSHYWRWL